MERGFRTVRRQVRGNTHLVRLTLDHLAKVGVFWAPRFLSIDGDEEILSWLPGQTIEDWRRRPELLDELARKVRDLHDLTAELTSQHECLVHDDLQPRNVVVVDGEQLGLIDWEQLRPGQRVEDVAQLCWSFAGPVPGDDVEAIGSRWQRLVDVYGLVDRTEVLSVAIAKIDRCIHDIVRQADLGSARHQLLLERGDHRDLEAVHRWLVTNHAAMTHTIE